MNPALIGALANFGLSDKLVANGCPDDDAKKFMDVIATKLNPWVDVILSNCANQELLQLIGSFVILQAGVEFAKSGGNIESITNALTKSMESSKGKEPEDTQKSESSTDNKKPETVRKPGSSTIKKPRPFTDEELDAFECEIQSAENARIKREFKYIVNIIARNPFCNVVHNASDGTSYEHHPMMVAALLRHDFGKFVLSKYAGGLLITRNK